KVGVQQKRLRRVPAFDPPDALYRLVSTPHGTSARGPVDRRREQGVPQPGLEDLGASRPDGDRAGGRREAPPRDREGGPPPGRRHAVGAGEAAVRADGARAAPGETPDLGGPRPTEERDRPLLAVLPRREHTRERGVEGLFRRYVQKQ